VAAPAREGVTKAVPPRRGFRLVRPYSTLAGAKAALDNGGRFYHLIARGGDGRLAKSEISKAAGVVLDEPGTFVFFDMALAKLTADEKAEVVAMLGTKLARRYRERGPRHALPREAARLGSVPAVITEGVPRFERQITILQTGVVMVGKVMVPVTHQHPFDLYDLSGLGLGVWHKESRLAPVPTRFGGRTSWERVKMPKGEKKQLLLLPAYHTPLD